jgi:hypothetical protein
MLWDLRFEIKTFEKENQKMSRNKAFFILLVLIICLFVTQVHALPQIQAVSLTEKTVQMKKINLTLNNYNISKTFNTLQQPSYIEWAYLYGISGYNCWPQSINSTQDGGFILAARFLYMNQNYIYVVKTDSNGIIEWSKLYGDGLISYEPSSIQQTSDNGYIISGECGDLNQNGLLLLKLNSLGNIQWMQSENDHTSFADCKQYLDGGYIVASTFSDKLIIRRTNSVGTKLWERQITPAINNPISNSKVLIESTTGNIVVVGCTFLATRATYVYKYNSSGILLMNKVFSNIQNLKDVKQTQGSGYIMISSWQYPDFRNSSVMKVDNSFGTEWLQLYSDPETQYFFGESINQTPDGGFILGNMVKYIASGKESLYLIKTDSVGSIEWTLPLAVGQSQTAMYVKYTTDDGYIVGGTVTINNMKSSYLLKLK